MGNPIQLRGMSTHGLQWFPQIINNNAFSALANDWEADMIRLAMYIGEDGYATDPSVKRQGIRRDRLRYRQRYVCDRRLACPFSQQSER
ncbi:MAG: cellulase family glycosylhydrolase [Alkalibacterium sp.]|nr:cellulase family glycosylhydrolase [Alkalibacterium sp.]